MDNGEAVEFTMNEPFWDTSSGGYVPHFVHGSVTIILKALNHPGNEGAVHASVKIN
jgi:hypothetical protein